MLLDRGAGKDDQDELGFTPLHWAAFTGQIEVCKLLISRGASYDIENKAHQTALEFDKVKEKRGLYFLVN